MKRISIYVPNFPNTGWIVDGKVVHPPNAYTHLWYWLNYITTIFPGKGNKIQDSISNAIPIKQDALLKAAVYKLCEYLNRKYT